MLLETSLTIQRDLPDTTAHTINKTQQHKHPNNTPKIVPNKAPLLISNWVKPSNLNLSHRPNLAT